MRILYVICSFIFCFIINGFIYKYQIKKEIKNNIDLFIKKHESIVIHEVNNELFKNDLKELNINEKN